MERNKPKREKTTYYFLLGHAPSNSFHARVGNSSMPFPAGEDSCKGRCNPFFICFLGLISSTDRKRCVCRNNRNQCYPKEFDECGIPHHFERRYLL